MSPGLPSKLTKSLALALFWLVFASNCVIGQLSDVRSVEESMRVGDYEKAIEIAKQQVENLIGDSDSGSMFFGELYDEIFRRFAVGGCGCSVPFLCRRVEVGGGEV